jgi:hypothetical protein
VNIITSMSKAYGLLNAHSTIKHPYGGCLGGGVGALPSLDGGSRFDSWCPGFPFSLLQYLPLLIPSKSHPLSHPFLSLLRFLTMH